MIPILASAYPYTGNGLGGLSDAISCKVTHEVNGVYDLQMQYPVTGLHFSELLTNYVVMAKPDALTAAQPFRIYRITKPLNGIVTVYAHHICYDMSGTVVEPFTSGSLTAVMTDLPNKCTPASSITISTTRSVATSYTLKEPRALWRVLGGQEGSLLDIYGGEWDFNLLTANLVTTLGTDRGVNIRYGKNLTKLEQDLSLESTYAGVFPYWYDEEANTLVTLTEKYVTIAGASSSRILCLDCSDEFEAQPTEQELRDYTNAYITKNSCGDPKISWKIDFVMLSQAGEYATQAALEQVGLGDTVHVYYEALGVNASARAVKMEWDVLKDNYISVTVGRVKQNLASIIVGQNRETEDKIKSTKSFLEQAIDDATYSIRHGGGVFRLIYNGDDLQEIVSLDDPDIGQALSVWRWNNGGFGHSSTGYSGNYTLALLPDGSINASVITTGTLNANVIRAGILQDTANKNSWNLTTGAFTITDGSIHITTTSQSYDAISLNYNEFTSSVQPVGFYTSNTSTDKQMIMQAGALYGYSDVSNNNYQQIYLGHGSLYLGSPTANGGAGYAGIRNNNGNETVSISGTNGTVTATGSFLAPTAYFGGSNSDGYVTLRDSASNNRVTLYGQTGQINLYDSSSVNRVSIYGGNGSAAFRDASNVDRIKLSSVGGQINLTTTSGTDTIVLYGTDGRIKTFDSSGNEAFSLYSPGSHLYISYNNQYAARLGAYSTSDPYGALYLYDTAAHYRVKVYYDGINFYNSSSVITATYPATGTEYKSGTAITSNVPSGTATNVRSLQLTAGKYLIFAQVAWSDSSNATGYREACIGTTSGNVASGAAWDYRGAVSGDATRQSLSAYITPSATTTYYFVLKQNSGSQISLGAYSLYAIKLP